MSLINFIKLNNHGDERGRLISVEENISTPFSIKRIYFILDTNENVSRGFHAHKDLKQIVICLKGSCRFVLDDGLKKEVVTLNSNSDGLIIEDLTWREMHDFSNDCILAVIANNEYDESDYIRDYKEFLIHVKGENK